MSSDLVTTKWAAEALGCSPSTVRRLVDRGELPAAMKVPGSRGAFMFRMSDVIRCATKRSSAA